MEKDEKTVVNNYVSGFQFNGCEILNPTFQTIVQGDMRMEGNGEKACPAKSGTEKSEATSRSDAPDDEVTSDPLRNLIFDTRLFDTDRRLKLLRECIASAIDLGEASVLYGGRVQEMRIDPNQLSDWYYIFKPLCEARLIKGKPTDSGFVEQMANWFPTLFPTCESAEEFKNTKRKIAKAISTERGKWKNPKNHDEIPLEQMWAKEKLVRIDRAKKERVYELAHQGLLRSLKDLKRDIEREKTNR